MHGEKRTRGSSERRAVKQTLCTLVRGDCAIDYMASINVLVGDMVAWNQCWDRSVDGRIHDIDDEKGGERGECEMHCLKDAAAD